MGVVVLSIITLTAYKDKKIDYESNATEMHAGTTTVITETPNKFIFPSVPFEYSKGYSNDDTSKNYWDAESQIEITLRTMKLKDGETVKSYLEDMIKETELEYALNTNNKTFTFNNKEERIIENNIDGETFTYTRLLHSESNYSFLGLYEYNGGVARLQVRCKPSTIDYLGGEVFIPTKAWKDFFDVMKAIIELNKK